jgi:hypothetical protein
LGQQALTLLATVVGAIIGLLAPLISSTLSRRSDDRDSQREIASRIISLFDDGGSPVELLHGRQSPARRQLFLLALRLTSQSAYDAAMRFIACADRPDLRESDVLEIWELMIGEVAKIHTGRSLGRT